MYKFPNLLQSQCEELGSQSLGTEAPTAFEVLKDKARRQV